MREDIVRATDLIPKRKDFPQKLQSQGTKFTFSPMETFQKKSCGTCTYDKGNVKPKKSATFHFDQVIGV